MKPALMDEAHEYAIDIVEGNIPANRFVKSVCQRHLDDLKDTESPYFYDREAADRICLFASRMKLNEGKFAGKRMKLLPWQHFLLRSLFGWRHKEKQGGIHPRRYRRCLLETGKGSGKKGLTAAIALYLAFFDNEQGAQVFVAAETFEQAGIIMKEVLGFWQQSEGLQGIMRMKGGVDTPRMFSAFDGRGYIQRYTLGNRAPSGEMPSAIIADEGHEHVSERALGMLEANIKSRIQPLVMITSNAGHGNAGPYFLERTLAEAAALGDSSDNTYFSLIYTVENKDNSLEDEDCWIKANPSLPVVPGIPYIRAEVEKAKSSASYKVRVLRLNFGVWSDGVEAWLDPDAWKRAETSQLSSGREAIDCVIGLDLSLRKDLTSAAAVWDFGDRLEAETFSWTPEEDLYDRQERERQPYLEWVAQGYLTTIAGRYIEYSAIVEWLKGMMRKWNVVVISYDPQGIDYFRKRLNEAGIEFTMDSRFANDKLLMIPHPQGFKRGKQPAETEVEQHKRDSQLEAYMPTSIDAIEGEILQGRLKVMKSPVLRAAANGAYLAMDGSANRRMMKSKSLCKIDPLMALTMGVGAAIARRDTIGKAGYWTDEEFYRMLYGDEGKPT